MTAQEIDAYLAGVDDPGRSTLQAMRETITALLPDAEQGLSYNVPAFRVDGRVVAGLAAFRRHVAYLPHSGDVLHRLDAQLTGFERTRSSLHVPLDSPLDPALIEQLLAVKLAQIEGARVGGRGSRQHPPE